MKVIISLMYYSNSKTSISESEFFLFHFPLILRNLIKVNLLRISCWQKLTSVLLPITLNEYKYLKRDKKQFNFLKLGLSG